MERFLRPTYGHALGSIDERWAETDERPVVNIGFGGCRESPKSRAMDCDALPRPECGNALQYASTFSHRGIQGWVCP